MASDQPYLGSVDLWPMDWAPRGYTTCQGQTMPISQYTALFSLLGTTFGGNGVSTFQLPDMQGRLPVGAGNGAGLTPRVLGEKSGVENVTLLATNMPMHTHLAAGTVKPGANTGRGTYTNDPTNNYPAAISPSTTTAYGSTANAVMGQSNVTVTVQTAGSGLPFSIMPPYLVLTYIIALVGIFPSRN